MTNLPQRATVSQAAKIPAGQSQFKSRPQHPFLTAKLEQFRAPYDGRKWRPLARLRQAIAHGYVKMGADATARMLQRYLRKSDGTPAYSLRNIKDGQKLVRDKRFALVENIGLAPDRRRRAHGYFDGDRMTRSLHPERLRPPVDTSPPKRSHHKQKQAKGRESCTPVGRESCTHNALGSNSRAFGHVPPDTSHAQNRASDAGEPQTVPETKPAPSALELFDGFANEYGEDIADGVLGWIAYRKMHGSASAQPVKNPWAYFRAGIKNFLDYDDGKQMALINRHSFCHLMNLPRPEKNIWRNDQCDALRVKLDWLDEQISYWMEFIPAKIGTEPRWFAEGKENTLARLKRQRTKLRRQLRELVK